MGLYDRYVLPHLIHAACGSAATTAQRARVVPRARGRVLELGIGSGLNLPLYGSSVERVWGLDPSPGMRAKAAPRLRDATVDVEWLTARAEQIPLPDQSIDTVVVTFTLCTVDDPVRALDEARRVLVPGGQLLFVEHGLAPDEGVRRWQRRLNPAWRRVAGGCNLDRDISRLVRGAFDVTELESGYVPGTPRFAGFNTVGAASRPAR